MYIVRSGLVVLYTFQTMVLNGSNIGWCLLLVRLEQITPIISGNSVDSNLE